MIEGWTHKIEDACHADPIGRYAMPIARMDHFTIVTKDVAATEKFYRHVLELIPGPRPDFAFPGVWLYNDGPRRPKV
jgi:hypothetical protein